MEHIKLYALKGDEEYMTHCSAFDEEYVHSNSTVTSFKERNVYCDRKDCLHYKDGTIGKCGRKKIKVITGFYGDSECRCINYERKESDV